MKLVIFLALFTLATCDYPPAVPDEPSSEAPVVPAETYGPPAEVPVSSTEVAISLPPEVPVPEVPVPVPEVPKTPADVELLTPGAHFPFLPPTVNLFSDLVVPHPIPAPAPFIPENPYLVPDYPIYNAPAPPPIDIPPINIPPVLPPGVLPPGILPPGVLPPVQPPVSPFHVYAPPPVFPKPLPYPLLSRPITHHVTTTHIIPPPRVNQVYFERPVLPEIPLYAPPVSATLPPVYAPPVYAPPVPLPSPVIPAPLPAPIIPEPLPVVPNFPVPVLPEVVKEPEVPHVPAPTYGVPFKK